MDLEKIGKFIAKKRQDNSYTQESLAEKLNISNRSISKWERGVCLPDANNMAKLCKLFDISYNELLSGEEINQKDYKQHSEKLLEEFSKIEKQLENDPETYYRALVDYDRAHSFSKRLLRQAPDTITMAEYNTILNKLVDAKTEEEFNTILRSVK